MYVHLFSSSSSILCYRIASRQVRCEWWFTSRPFIHTNTISSTHLRHVFVAVREVYTQLPNETSTGIASSVASFKPNSIFARAPQRARTPQKRTRDFPNFCCRRRSSAAMPQRNQTNRSRMAAAKVISLSFFFGVYRIRRTIHLIALPAVGGGCNTKHNTHTLVN